MSTYKHTTYAYLNTELVGKIFREGEVSANYTMVAPEATVRLAGTSMFLEHEYPEAEKFSKVGDIKKLERLEDGTWLAYFEVYNEKVKEALLNNELALSVSWVSDDYTKRDDGVFVFSDIAIYEVSVVSNPAFDTCAAESAEKLTCLNKQTFKNCGCGKPIKPEKHCGCGKPIKPNETGIFGNMKHQTVEERVQMLEDAVTMLKDSIDVLTQKYDELVAKLDSMMQTETQAVDEEFVQNAVQEAEKRLAAIVDVNNNKLETLSEHLLKLIETLKKV